MQNTSRLKWKGSQSTYIADNANMKSNNCNTVIILVEQATGPLLMISTNHSKQIN